MKAPGFWDGRGLVSTLLAPAGWAYAFATAKRVARPPTYHAPCPVLCIGNIIAGGAGKTPVVRDVTERLRARGCNAKVLTRGYGGRFEGPVRVEPGTHGSLDVGDEGLMLARTVPVWIANDRAKGAAAMVEKEVGCIVMDDGHQNPDLAKTASWVVVDGTYGFGNGRAIPAGPLRESPHAGLARADCLVVMGGETAPVAPWFDGPRLAARIRPEAAPDLKGERVFALSAIGRPAKFHETLRTIGAEVVGQADFPDHHPYTLAEIEGVLRKADRLKARVVTTEKDAVRLPDRDLPLVRVLTITLEWDDEAALDALLEPFLTHV